ncbi:MAG: DUF5677 domain-containing protein [Candidatus Odinarchaeota archaeon]
MSEKNNSNEKKHTPINKLKRKGKIFSSPHKFLENLKPIAWDRDLLPEFIWMDALHQKFRDFTDLFKNFKKFLDILDGYINTDETLLLGLISDFGKIPEEKRDDLLNKNSKLIKELFVDLVGQILVLYPDCPALWLIPDKEKKRFEEKDSVKEVLNTIVRLYPGKEDEYCRELRILPLQRILEHEKISFTPQVEWPRLLPKYPHYLTKEEKEQCERMVILTTNMFIDNPEGSEKRFFHWSKHFWNQNLILSPCITNVLVKDDNFREITEEFIKDLNEYTDYNMKSLKKYLFDDLKDFKYELYDPTKDKVIIGLFSRILRLCIAFLKAPELWVGDFSKIFIRCILDSTIVLKYLLKENDISLFEKFIEYGRGKEKLQILHSQNVGHNEKSAGSDDSSKLANELGSDFFIEALKINVGNWIDKSVRDMAIECNMHREYVLIYNPTSEDVHGSWLSIKKSSLMNCMNPLHRFHKVPRSYEPLDPDLFDIMIDIVEDVIRTCENEYNFPKFNYELKKIQEIAKNNKGNS